MFERKKAGRERLERGLEAGIIPARDEGRYQGEENEWHEGVSDQADGTV